MVRYVFSLTDFFEHVIMGWLLLVTEGCGRATRFKVVCDVKSTISGNVKEEESVGIEAEDSTGVEIGTGLIEEGVDKG